VLDVVAKVGCHAYTATFMGWFGGYGVHGGASGGEGVVAWR